MVIAYQNALYSKHEQDSSKQPDTDIEAIAINHLSSKPELPV